MSEYEKLRAQREEVAYFMRRLYKKDLTTCSGGNISLRTEGGIVLITPASLDKGELTADQVVAVTMDGKCLSTNFKPTIEMNLHLSVFRMRPDVNAVVHAHPTFATTFACMKTEIDVAMTGEVYAIVGSITKSDFSVAGSDDLAVKVAESLRSANTALMQNHGVITVGETMLKAFDRLEVTEVAAKMTWIARTMTNYSPLSEDQQKAIRLAFWR